MFVCIYLLVCVVLLSFVTSKLSNLRAERRLKLRKVEMLRKQVSAGVGLGRGGHASLDAAVAATLHLRSPPPPRRPLRRSSTGT